MSGLVKSGLVKIKHETLRPLPALKKLSSLALLGYFMSGANLSIIASTIGGNLRTFETWIPFRDQNVLCEFSQLEVRNLMIFD